VDTTKGNGQHENGPSYHMSYKLQRIEHKCCMFSVTVQSLEVFIEILRLKFSPWQSVTISHCVL